MTSFPPGLAHCIARGPARRIDALLQLPRITAGDVLPVDAIGGGLANGGGTQARLLRISQ